MHSKERECFILLFCVNVIILTHTVLGRKQYENQMVLLFFELCVMFTIAGCGTVSDREVKMRYGVSFVSVESHISF